MDNMQSELAELKQFIAELKADRAANQEKELRESWTKYVSLTVVILAVVVSIASQRAGKYSGLVQISQAQASDQWNFYQAQSIKQHVYEMFRHQAPSATGAATALTPAQEKDFDAKISGYEKKKEEIKAKALDLEKTRDAAASHNARLGPAVSSFTIAIAIASICLMTKKKPIWLLSLALAVLGFLFWTGVVAQLIRVL